jgi:hypothetical protein
MAARGGTEETLIDGRRAVGTAAIKFVLQMRAVKFVPFVETWVQERTFLVRGA